MLWECFPGDSETLLLKLILIKEVNKCTSQIVCGPRSQLTRPTRVLIEDVLVLFTGSAGPATAHLTFPDHLRQERDTQRINIYNNNIDIKMIHWVYRSCYFVHDIVLLNNGVNTEWASPLYAFFRRLINISKTFNTGAAIIIKVALLAFCKRNKVHVVRVKVQILKVKYLLQ